jgi:hypothetical protein
VSRLVFPLEAELRARPDDEALWTVAADRWLEQGNAWGARVGARATGFPPEDALLNAAVECLGLEVEWRMGFARRAAIRPACARRELSPGAVLAALLSHPLGQFLEQLEIDGLPLFDLREQGMQRDALRAEFLSFLEQWLPLGVTSLDIGVSMLGLDGELERVARPLAFSRPRLRQRYWLHGTMRMDPGGEVSPVFGNELDCLGLVRCKFRQLPGGTHALHVSDDSQVTVTSAQGTRGYGPWWFPGETLAVKGQRFHFAEHTQTLLVIAGSL